MGLELSRAAGSGDFVLAEDGAEVARMVLAPSVVVRIDGRTLQASKYAPGFHLAFVDDELGDEDPVAWYAGGAGFGGGRIVVAGGREYRLRTRYPLGTRWRVLEGRREVLRAQAVRRWPDARVELEWRGAPSAAEDAPLLAALVGLVVLLQTREPQGGRGDAG